MTAGNEAPALPPRGDGDPDDVWRPGQDWRSMPPPAPPEPWASPAYPLRSPLPYAPPVPPGPPGPPGERSRDGVSIAAFVTGLLGLVLVSVALAIAGLVRT